MNPPYFCPILASDYLVSKFFVAIVAPIRILQINVFFGNRVSTISAPAIGQKASAICCVQLVEG